MPLGLTFGAIHPGVADELTWRWQWADGDMGLHSNFNAMISMIERGGHSGARPMAEIDDRSILAAAKVRHIDRALARLDDRDVDMLFAVCGAPTGDMAALLRLIPIAHKAHARSGSAQAIDEWVAQLFAHVASRADPIAYRLADAIRRQSRTLLGRASERYVEARRYPSFSR